MDRKAFILLAVIGIAAVFLTIILIGCSQEVDFGEVVNIFSGKDNITPKLVGSTTASGNVVKLEFSEPVKVYGDSFEPFRARADGKFVYVTLNSRLSPGIMSTIGGRVKDYSGNTTGFTIQVWGLNQSIPQVLINEFTTKGTQKSPDRTELRILSDGNLNGMTIYSGTPDEYDIRFIFGDLVVFKGDFVVIWWTEELPEGVETRIGNVHNICIASANTPSSNNGTIVLCNTPSLGARILDAVVYSNYSQSYEGFGTKSALERAKWVISAGAWKGDAIDSTGSTATRSMFRSLDGADTDGSSDWSITVTGGSTFGLPNTSESM